MEIVRTEYRNLSDGTVREDLIKVAESLNDIENYVLPLDRIRGRGGQSAGVIEGLAVSAQTGQRGISVTPGTALDQNGNLAVLSVGGAGVVDPQADPANVENIPTVVVGPNGVSVTTAGLAGECLVTINAREVAGAFGQLVRRHAPWVRIRVAAEGPGSAEAVVLGRVSLDADGRVTALATGPRQPVGLRAGRIELSVVQKDSDGVVGQRASSELVTASDGGVELRLLSGTDGPPLRALAVNAGGTLTVAAGLRLPRTGATDGFSMWTGADQSWRVTDLATTTDRLKIDNLGNVGMGLGAETLPDVGLNVAERAVHSGGTVGGFSFADRSIGSYVRRPDKGQRWVWYAFQGAARLWSGGDKLTIDVNGNVGINLPDGKKAMRSLHVSGGLGGVHTEGSNGGFSFAGRDQPLDYLGNPGAGERWVWYSAGGAAMLWSGRDRMIYGGNDRNLGLDIFRRVRIRQDGGDSAGLWFFQDGPQADRAFVGMRSNDQVGFYGATGIGWGMMMNTTDGSTQFVGTVSKADGRFRIDHPLDPTGAYLNHSFVEGPERLNVYVGSVVTDAQGEAVIELPSYFGALNRDARVQLTPFGSLARVAICTPVQENRVRIVADVPGVEVSWQVTGVRQDRWAEMHPFVVEEQKVAAERGRYLHPEAFGQPAELGLHRSPTMKEARRR